MRAVTVPEVSVVLVTPDDARRIRRTLHHLRSQTIADAIELIIGVRCAEGLGLRDEDVAGIGTLRVVERTTRVLADLRATAIAIAAAPIIAFAEDHCFPGPEWAARLVAAHRAGARAVGPLMHNENPRSALSRTAMVLQFPCCSPPATGGPRDALPWHNTSYRRADLLAYDDRLGWWLTAEGPIQDRLREAGHGLVLAGDAEVSHVNISRVRAFVRQGFWGGRLFAATRNVAREWGFVARLGRALASPLVPFVRTARVAATLRRDRRLGELPALLPALAIGTFSHAFGEAVGALFGMGATRERYSDFEHDRLRYVNRHDQMMLVEREPPGGAVIGSRG